MASNSQLHYSNVYSRIPPSLLRSICTERGLSVYGPSELSKLDEIYCDSWIRKVRETKSSNYSLLSLPQLVCYAAMIGVPLEGLPMPLRNMGPLCLLVGRIHGSVDRESLRSVNGEILEMLLEQVGYRLPECFMRTLSRERLEEMFCSLPVTPFTGKEWERGMRYRSVNNHERGDLIKSLYGTKEEYLDVAPNWAENLVRNPESFTLEVCAHLRIMVPSGKSLPKWFLDNILSYLPIWNRGTGDLNRLRIRGLPFFHLMTDVELREECRVWFPYNSRAGLVEGLERMRRTPTFFVPYHDWPWERARNRDFETYGSGDDIRTSRKFLLGFGSYESAYIYEVDDLLGSFYFEDKFFAFRSPHAPQREIFSEKNIKELENILRNYPEEEGVGDLLQRIKEGTRYLQKELSHRDYQVKVANSLETADRNRLRSLLLRIADLGFYMRRWKGPGNPLPLREKDTVSEVDPDTLVREFYKETHEAIQESPTAVSSLLWSFQALRYRQGDMERVGRTLKYWWKGIGKGTICIRIASAVLIGIAYYYSNLIFGEPLSFPISEVDLIA